MKFFSTNNPHLKVDFQSAVLNSLPQDNGLYFPESIPALPSSFFKNLKTKSKADIGFEVAKALIGDEIPADRLYQIVEETIDFELPMVSISTRIHALELFHGPTWAFKDVGARFLSRCMGYFLESQGEEVHVLVATSGDTGSAVAAGFHGIPGIQVTILFPKGKVSGIQQLQLTTWGGNIRALEVDGTFDDCQRLVKTAFLDKELNEKLRLSSANSINIARLIPQSFYYFYAFQQLVSWEKTVVAVPSGNYGNLTAGLLAWKMGLPVHRFIAASNANRIVPEYLETGIYTPKPSVQTYANAMDVGAPSNFARMLTLFDQSHVDMTHRISGFSLNDVEILEEIKRVNDENGYLLDPHGAIGHAALGTQLHPDEQGIFLETAHPVKFLNVIEMALGTAPDYAEKISQWTSKTEQFDTISKDYASFRERLM
jgi:threonine synthase